MLFRNLTRFFLEGNVLLPSCSGFLCSYRSKILKINVHITYARLLSSARKDNDERTVKETMDLLKNARTSTEDEFSSPDDQWSSSVYPIPKTQTDEQELEDTDPSQSTVIMFPGQGSQRRGMGKSLLMYNNVPEMYKTASEILKYDLLELCLNGPQEKLNETRYCQPALLVTCLAAVEKLKETNPEAVENCGATMGFSVGEFASLVFAGALSFEAAVRLVQIRGEAMQAASNLIPSGMLTMFLAPDSKLPEALEASREWAAKVGVKHPVCSVSNYLYPSCKVIAGNMEALEFLEKNCKEYRIKNTKRIAVSGAFHTALMEPAMEAWKMALSQVTFSEPLLPVYSNVSGHPHTFDTIVRMLRKHLVYPVKWEQCLTNLYRRPKEMKFPKTYECGPGQSLNAILKRVNMKSWKYAYNVDV